VSVLERVDFERIKHQAVENALTLHQKLTKLVLYNGITEKKWNHIVNNLSEKRLSRIKFITEFLKELEKTIWKDMYEVWTQPNVTPEIWENYKLFDCSKLIEVKQMKELSKQLKGRLTKWTEQLRERIVAEREGRVIDDPNDVKVTPEELLHESKAIT
jgi:hypothetical protein